MIRHDKQATYATGDVDDTNKVQRGTLWVTLTNFAPRRQTQGLQDSAVQEAFFGLIATHLAAP